MRSLSLLDAEEAGLYHIAPSFYFVSLYTPKSKSHCSFHVGSHKRRDKRCHIAAPLLRAAFHTVLEKHDISIDETGASLACPEGEALEELDVTDKERDAEAARRLSEIESVGGGEGGEVGIFNINHLGGHRYAGVMLVSLCCCLFQ